MIIHFRLDYSENMASIKYIVIEVANGSDGESQDTPENFLNGKYTNTQETGEVNKSSCLSIRPLDDIDNEAPQTNNNGDNTGCCDRLKTCFREHWLDILKTSINLFRCCMDIFELVNE